jgi:hypothetical protein
MCVLHSPTATVLQYVTEEDISSGEIKINTPEERINLENEPHDADDIQLIRRPFGVKGPRRVVSSYILPSQKSATNSVMPMYS